MSQDRFVWMEHPPNAGELELLLEDFLGGFLERGEFCEQDRPSLVWKDGRWFATLVGWDSHALRRAPFITDAMRAYYAQVHGVRQRFIEVYIGDDYVDVITRQADDATNALADRLAELIARCWKGRLEK